MSNFYEIIQDKLYYETINSCSSLSIQCPSTDTGALCFTIDDRLLYTSFFADFGPLDINSTHKFFKILDDNLSKAEASHQKVIFYSSNHPHRRANAVTLICAYMVCVLNKSPIETYSVFRDMSPPLTPYRDAAFSTNSFPVTIIDCIKAFHRAVILGCYSYALFSSEKFEAIAKLENGDCSWIIPGKFIAFSGPLSTRRDLGNGKTTLLPHEYVPILKALGVTCIIRFNSKCYDRNVFINAGIRHEDLLYEDGGNPTESILQSFLRICESEKGAIAVHCKAGLGRTGTNIAAYMIKHFEFTAREAIAWCRLCRPGSIVGPQQQYLVSIEPRMKEQGERFRQIKDSTEMRRTNSAVRAMTNSFSSSYFPFTSKVIVNKATDTELPFIETSAAATRLNNNALVRRKETLTKTKARQSNNDADLKKQYDESTRSRPSTGLLTIASESSEQRNRVSGGSRSDYFDKERRSKSAGKISPLSAGMYTRSSSAVVISTINNIRRPKTPGNRSYY